MSNCTWNLRGMSAAISYHRTLAKRHDVRVITKYWQHANKLNIFDESAVDMEQFAV